MKLPHMRKLVLISYVVYASEECAADKSSKGVGRNCDEYNAPIECYECSTYANDQYCADPFNETHPDIRVIPCHESCAKWVRKPKIGDMHVIRTCSASLRMQMPVANVCMKESRPGDGHLCFCKKGRCNSAPRGLHQASKLPAILLSLLTLLLLQKYCSGYTNIARWWTAVPWTLTLLVSKWLCYQAVAAYRKVLWLCPGQGLLIGDPASLENG